MKSYSLTDLRHFITAILEHLRESQQPALITSRGHPVAVLVPIDLLREPPEAEDGDSPRGSRRKTAEASGSEAVPDEDVVGSEPFRNLMRRLHAGEILLRAERVREYDPCPALPALTEEEMVRLGDVAPAFRYARGRGRQSVGHPAEPKCSQGEKS